MDFKAQLALEHSKKNSLLIADYIGKDKERLEKFLACVFSEESIIAQRSAMVLSAIFDRNPEMIQAHISALIRHLEKPGLHIAVTRNIIRILQFCTIPEAEQAFLFDYCLAELEDPNSPIAVKAFSMQVLVNLCEVYPEFKQELIPLLELELSRNESKGVQHRGKAMLKKLRKI